MTIQVTAVNVLDNPSKFLSNFKFEIVFDCLAPGIKGELEWKLIYVASASDEDKDQEIDTVLVGPVKVGKNRFIFEAPPPDYTKIPQAEILGVTVVLLLCLYKDQEFIRVGFYVSNEIENESSNNMSVNTNVDISKVTRHILGDKPRVTRFPIKWDEDYVDDKNGLDYKYLMDEESKENNKNNNNNGTKMTKEEYEEYEENENVEEDEEDVDDDNDIDIEKSDHEDIDLVEE